MYGRALNRPVRFPDGKAVLMDVSGPFRTVLRDSKRAVRALRRDVEDEVARGAGRAANLSSELGERLGELVSRSGERLGDRAVRLGEKLLERRDH